MKKREDRRDRTWRKGFRRRRDHLRERHPSGVVDCVCELSVWRFAKRPRLGCEKCRGRRRGNPKIGSGICAIGDYKYRAAIVLRIAGRRAARRWMVAIDVDDVDE